MMVPHVNHIGSERVPVLTVDGYETDLDAIVETVRGLAPFAPATNYYPGERHVLGPTDDLGRSYIQPLLIALAPILGQAFGAKQFVVDNVSLSKLTRRPDELHPLQRMPHFDFVDDTLIAILHYLSPTQGTAFYRHRATGYERITAQRRSGYIAEAQDKTPPDGYICGSNDEYEQIGSVTGHFGRIAAYPANVLHSSLIPNDFFADGEPKERITANIFVRLA